MTKGNKISMSKLERKKTVPEINFAMVFCYQNCSDLLWEKIDQEISEEFFLAFKYSKMPTNFITDFCPTLASGIDVGPTFINFGFFSRPYGLIREYIKVIYMVIYYIGHVYLRPYVYSFCQTFQALRLFPTLRLFRRLE